MLVTLQNALELVSAGRGQGDSASVASAFNAGTGPSAATMSRACMKMDLAHMIFRQQQWTARMHQGHCTHMVKWRRLFGQFHTFEKQAPQSPLLRWTWFGFVRIWIPEMSVFNVGSEVPFVACLVRSWWSCKSHAWLNHTIPEILGKPTRNKSSNTFPTIY